MAQNRPDKPLVTLPDDFGGTQTAFEDSLVENGYEASTPEILEGGNLNYMLNGLFQNTKYMRAVLDYVRDTPVGKMFWVNQSGQMDYVQPAIIATDAEFSTGTATDKTPSVKQVADKLAVKVNTTDMQNYVASATSALLNSVYPVGSIYIGTQSTCPMASLIAGSTWTLVSSGRALWTGNGSNGNSTISAGLPNITGNFQAMQRSGYTATAGAFYNANGGAIHSGSSHTPTNDTYGRFYFNASRSSSIYGNSSTVQPPAYVVNVWRRTA